MTVTSRTPLKSWVLSCTKSYAHTWLGLAGRSRTQDPFRIAPVRPLGAHGGAHRSAGRGSLGDGPGLIRRAGEGAVESVVVTLQDMTPLEELERLRAEFLGMVSHELRAPLTSIRGSVTTLLE